MLRDMNRMNRLFTLTSLSVVLVTVERFSFTTRVLLEPHAFLRLHELLQMVLIVLVTVLIPSLLLREVSADFTALRSRGGTLLFLLFVVGIYYYSTGNGVHEVASFTFNTYCDPHHFSGSLCGGQFDNDFYTGNILFFVGGFLMTVSLLAFERHRPSVSYAAAGRTALLVNGTIYALTVLAYAGFDRVLVGLEYSVAMWFVTLAFFLPVRKRYLEFPFITYTTLVYTLGTVSSIIVRLAR
ncbi:hypothetical protein [Catenulispora rubra]|uniref:hypothetical protein n=1 Tax=Catenulispora rubra TaxID=280293 RepID=UPI0018922187|nr:hypothetical protein [Catenulispora rubra]